MEASQPQLTPVQQAQQQLGEDSAAVEQEFADSYAAIDGDYSKIAQYAGLVRDELLNIAKQRRVVKLAAAQAAYETAIHGAAGTEAPTPPPEAAQTPPANPTAPAEAGQEGTPPA